MNTQQQYQTLRGARDMLRESAKQHRSNGDTTGHARMCDAHANNIDAVLNAREFILDPTYMQAKHVAEHLSHFLQCTCDLDKWEPEQSTGHTRVCNIHKAAVSLVS